jgi:hypothetical protein
MRWRMWLSVTDACEHAAEDKDGQHDRLPWFTNTYQFNIIYGKIYILVQYT